MSTHEQAVAQGLAVLAGDDERVLGVAGGVAGREVERLEVVVVGFDLGADSDGVAHALENADNFVQGLDERMLGSGLAPRAGERDVDGFSVERGGVAGSGGGFEALLDFGFQLVEALTEGFFRFGWSGFQPCIADGLEAALLASEPMETELLDFLRRSEHGCGSFYFA